MQSASSRSCALFISYSKPIMYNNLDNLVFRIQRLRIATKFRLNSSSLTMANSPKMSIKSLRLKRSEPKSRTQPFTSVGSNNESSHPTVFFWICLRLPNFSRNPKLSDLYRPYGLPPIFAQLLDIITRGIDAAVPGVSSLR